MFCKINVALRLILSMEGQEMKKKNNKKKEMRLKGERGERRRRRLRTDKAHVYYVLPLSTMAFLATANRYSGVSWITATCM